MEIEFWKDILGFEGRYQINRNGDVKSLPGKGVYKTKVSRILKHQQYPNKYFHVHIRKDGMAFHLMVHRLLAIAFIPNPLNKPQVNHINGIKTDNRIENLEWCTSRENTLHAVDLGLTASGERSHFCRLSSEIIDEMRRVKKQTGIKTEDLGKMYGVSRAHAYRIINFERRKLG